MKFSIAVTIVVILLSVSSFAAAQTATPSAAASPPEGAAGETAKARKDWQKAISRLPVPKKGCFTATYPKKEWREVPCGPPSKYPNTVGGSIGNDVGPQVTPLLISSAVGSFDIVTPATVTETGPWGGNPNSANAFTIQMNTRLLPESVRWPVRIHGVLADQLRVAVSVGDVDPVREQLLVQQRQLSRSCSHCGATAGHDAQGNGRRGHGYGCADVTRRQRERDGRG